MAEAALYRTASTATHGHALELTLLVKTADAVVEACEASGSRAARVMRSASMRVVSAAVAGNLGADVCCLFNVFGHTFMESQQNLAAGSDYASNSRLQKKSQNHSYIFNCQIPELEL